MPATTHNLQTLDRLEAGTTFRRSWQFNHPTSGLPENITGHTFSSSFRLAYSDEFPQFQAVVAVDDGPGGVIEFVISDTATETFGASVGYDATQMQGVWDLESVDGAGETTRWLEGTWVMTPEATQE